MIVDLKNKQWFLFSLFPLLFWSVLLTNFNFFYLGMAILGAILTGFNVALEEWRVGMDKLREWSFVEHDSRFKNTMNKPIFKYLGMLLIPYGVGSFVYFNIFIFNNFCKIPYYTWMLLFLTWATIFYGIFILIFVPEYLAAAKDGALYGFYSDNSGFWLSRAYKLMEFKKYEEAIQSLDKALSIDPKLLAAWGTRGGALGFLKRYEEAIQSYDKALEIEPTNSKTWYNRGVSLAKLERFEEALDNVNKALEFNPSYEKALKIRSEILAELKK